MGCCGWGHLIKYRTYKKSAECVFIICSTLSCCQTALAFGTTLSQLLLLYSYAQVELCVNSSALSGVLVVNENKILIHVCSWFL